jgi:hypothetical protein
VFLFILLARAPLSSLCDIFTWLPSVVVNIDWLFTRLSVPPSPPQPCALISNVEFIICFLGRECINRHNSAANDILMQFYCAEGDDPADKLPRPESAVRVIYV